MLKLAGHSYPDDALLIMAIVNRTPDSFYDRGATYAFDKALDRVGRGGRGRCRDRRHRRGEGGARRRGGCRRGDPAHGGLRGPGPRGVPGAGDLGRHLAARGGPGGLPGRRRPAQRRLGRAPIRSWPRWPRSSGSGWSAPTPAACSRGPVRTGSPTTTWSPTCCAYRRAGRTGRCPRAWTAQRILIDPGHDFGKNTWHSLEAHPPAGGAGGHRLAGAGVAVEQGLRRRGAGPAAGATAARHAGGDRGLCLAGRHGLPGAQHRRDPAGAGHGRHHPRAARRRAGPCGGWHDRRASPAARTRRCCCPASPVSRWPRSRQLRAACLAAIARAAGRRPGLIVLLDRRPGRAPVPTGRQAAEHRASAGCCWPRATRPAVDASWWSGDCRHRRQLPASSAAQLAAELPSRTAAAGDGRRLGPARGEGAGLPR